VILPTDLKWIPPLAITPRINFESSICSYFSRNSVGSYIVCLPVDSSFQVVIHTPPVTYKVDLCLEDGLKFLFEAYPCKHIGRHLNDHVHIAAINHFISCYRTNYPQPCYAISSSDSCLCSRKSFSACSLFIPIHH